MIAENRKNSTQVIASGKGRIRPRARLIRTIGAELISSEVVAVLELVRNCYDADARKVEVQFQNVHLPEQATLAIYDDGHGMGRDILLGPWLEPATDHKSSTGVGEFAGERSPRGRRRLGSKGVGRFAAQRLGEHLLVRSRQARNHGVLEAEFDWNLLDGSDRYLDELVVPWRELKVERRYRRGTLLLISRLRDTWTEERFERLRLALSRLLGPGLGDEFRIELIINGTREEVKPFIDALSPMYSIEGSVADDGFCQVTYRDVTGSLEEWHRSVLWPHKDTCGPFKFKISSWDLDREALEYFFRKAEIGLGLRDFRRVIRDHSGVSLYRDGFRILPYGEPDNDWLRLDRRRVNNPTLRLSNNQILGWVQLTADDNPLLQDQTNREGLVANAAYSHLQQVILELISYLETRRFTARRSFGHGNRSGNPSAQPPRFIDEDLEELAVRLAQHTEVTGDILPAFRDALSRGAERNLAFVQRYLRLAGAGYLSSRVVEELVHPTRQALTEADFLDRELVAFATVLPQESKDDLLVSVGKLKRSLAMLTQRIEKISSVVSDGPRPMSCGLGECVEAMGDLFLREFVRAGIELEIDIKEDLEILPFATVLDQVVAILFGNAVFWLKQAGSPKRLSVMVNGSTLIVENNGPRLPRDLQERIFESSFDHPAAIGLALARDLLKTIHGSIRLLRQARGIAFEVSLSKKP